MFRRSCILLVLLALCSTAFASETRVYELQYNQGDVLEEAVRKVLDDRAKVTSMRNHLVVVADENQLAVVDELVERLDRPSKMFRITIDQSLDEDESFAGGRASGAISSGDVLFTTGRRLPGNDPRISVRTENARVDLSANAGTERRRQSFSQFLGVMEGYPGRITVGRRIPFTETLLHVTRRHLHMIETIDYRYVDTGFEVLPTQYGDVVQLEVRPFMAFVDSRKPDEVVFRDLATRVRIPIGAWYDLGGHMSGQDDVSREILAAGYRGKRSGGQVRILVEPQF